MSDSGGNGARESGDADVVARASPSDAFDVLGNEIRTGIVETMLERVDDGDPRATFTDLFEASGLETSAQFAYHLERLEGTYLRKTDGGYEFTSAGLKLARSIAAGAYTRRVDRDPVAISEPCPFCGADELAARTADNVVTVGCGACDRTLLSLGFPPAGLEAHGEAFLRAFDRHHRHRLALAREGVCPECSGDVDARLVRPADAVADALPGDGREGVQAAFACRTCGHAVRCPVSLAVLEHPAVVSFFHERGRSIRDRPIWNVGHEWGETVLSTDPWCVRITVDVDGDVLALYVDEAVSVREIQRSEDEGTDVGSPSATAAGTADGAGTATE